MSLKYLLIDLFDTFGEDYARTKEFYVVLKAYKLDNVEDVIRSHIQFGAELPSLEALVKELFETEYSDYRKLFEKTYMNYTNGERTPPEVIAGLQRLGNRAKGWASDEKGFLDVELKKIFRQMKAGLIRLEHQHVVQLEEPQQHEPLDLKGTSFDQVLTDYKRAAN